MTVSAPLLGTSEDETPPLDGEFSSVVNFWVGVAVVVALSVGVCIALGFVLA
jgi:hypothetical protein